jgi:hypothetical protein
MEMKHDHSIMASKIKHALGDAPMDLHLLKLIDDDDEADVSDTYCVL